MICRASNLLNHSITPSFYWGHEKIFILPTSIKFPPSFCHSFFLFACHRIQTRFYNVSIINVYIISANVLLSKRAAAKTEGNIMRRAGQVVGQRASEKSGRSQWRLCHHDTGESEREKERRSESRCHRDY